MRLPEALKALPVETHLVMTRTAEVTLAHETSLKEAAVRKLADVAHSVDEITAGISTNLLIGAYSFSTVSKSGSRNPSSLYASASICTTRGSTFMRSRWRAA